MDKLNFLLSNTNLSYVRAVSWKNEAETRTENELGFTEMSSFKCSVALIGDLFKYVTNSITIKSMSHDTSLTTDVKRSHNRVLSVDTSPSKIPYHF